MLTLPLSQLRSSSIGKRNEIVFYLTQIFHSLVFTIPIWIVYYEARITAAEISILVTIQFIAQMVMELPSGALADMIGRRNTTFFGYAINGLSMLLFPFAVNVWHFALLAILVGVADSFRSGSEEALLFDTFKQEGKPEKYASVNAKGAVLYQGGLITGTALGGILYTFNQFSPYIIYGLSLAFGAMLVTRYIEPYIDSEVFTLKNYLKQIVIGSKEAFKNTYTKTLSLFYIFVAGISWSSALYFNSYMMVSLGFGDVARGLLGASMRLFNVVVIASVLKKSKNLDGTKTIMFFPIIMMLGYLPGRWLDGYFGLPFVQAAMIGSTARWIMLTPLTNNAFSSKYRATAISLLSFIYGFVFIGITAVSSFVIPAFGVKTMHSLLGVLTVAIVLPLGLRLIQLRKNKNIGLE